MRTLRWALGSLVLLGVLGLLSLGTSSPFIGMLANAQTDPCKPNGSGGFICTITFDVLPDGRVPSPFGDVIKEQYKAKAGVIFPNGGWVIRPKGGTSSGEFALINASSDGQLEFNAFPLKIEFADGVKVKRVKMHIGLHHADKGVTPTLKAFDTFDSKADPRDTMTYTPVIDGPTRIEKEMAVSAPTGTFIKRVELQYGGETPDARNAVEVIDDLEFETEGAITCPPSTDRQKPTVKITKPKDGEILNSSNLPQLAGTIFEDSGKFSDVALEIKGPAPTDRYTVTITNRLLSDKMVSGAFRFAVANLGLFFEGANEITVRADDSACPPNRGEAAIKVNVIKPPADLNLYAMAVEITQAIQDGLQVREVTHEGSDPRTFRPILYSGIPLVANKTTVVRVYAEIVEEPGVKAINGVPALLIIRRGGKEVRLTASGITVDPSDQVNRSGGTRDVEQTLEKKRADITKSWNFVLPASLTDEGTIDEIEAVVNPTELSGPQECLGCNDAANRLTVAKVPFQRTASLTIRSYYVLGDGKEAGSDIQVFCGGFLNMYPVRDGCGTGRIDTNDLPVGIGLLSLVAQTMKDSKGNLVTDRGIWQDQMCKKMVKDKGTFTPPAAYVAIGPGGMGGAPYNDISPAACAATVFPGYFEEFRYGVAAQEVGHGDFIGLWHACGNTPLGGWPKYKNAKGDEYYQGSIGQFGLDTSKLVVKDPAKISDFMGYTYCDVWTAGGLPDDNKIQLRAHKTIKIGESSTPSDDLLAKGVGGDVKARGLTFKLESLTQATSARAAEAIILISGTATACTPTECLYVQIDNRPPFKVSPTAGQPIKEIRDALANGLNGQPGVPLQELEMFSAFPWVSPFSYKMMFEKFKKPTAITVHRATDRETQAVSQREYLVASGRVGPENQVALDPFYRLVLPTGTSDEPGTGAYSFELQDQKGQVLFVRRFDPNPAHPDIPQIRRFYQTLPFAAGTARIVFKQGDKVLATRDVSANIPKVTLLAPNGGEFWGASATQVIQWTASDVDQDKLFYIVEYSKDGGQTWRTLASDLTDSKLTVDLAFLPGSDKALVRVLATDGVNTSQDQSDAIFKVAKKDPQIFITGMAENAVAGPGSVLNLQANVIDPNEDPIDEKTIVWKSDKIGVLGTGTRLEVSLDKLPPGAHQISLNVPGVQGQPITQSTAILRAPLLQEVPHFSTMSLSASATVAKACGANTTHEIEVSWNITGAQLPVQVIVETIDPMGITQSRTLDGAQGSTKLQIKAPQGGMARVRVMAKDSFGTSAFVVASPDVLPVAVLSVNQTALSFNGEAGRANPSAQTLNIANVGEGTLNWNASTDAGWLSVNPTSSTAPSTVSVSTNIAGLPAGTHQGRITITDTAPPNCSVQVPVTLALTVPRVTLTVDAIVDGSPISIIVPITVTTPDGRTSTRSTRFTLTLDQGTSVTLEAPGQHSGLRFKEWREGTAAFNAQTRVSLTLNQNRTLIAVYQRLGTVNVNAVCEGCAAGPVALAVSVSLNGVSGTTPFSREVNPGSTVTVGAPSSVTVSGRALNFQRWEQDGRTVSTSTSYNFTATGSITLRAVYAPPAPPPPPPPPTTVTLNLEAVCEGCTTGPVPIGVSITLNGSQSTTPFSRSVNQNSTVTVIAPSSTTASGRSLNFQRWEQNGRTASTATTYSFTATANTNLRAVYAPAPPPPPTQVTLSVEARLTNGQLQSVPIQVLNPAQGTRTTPFPVTVNAGTQVTLRAWKFTNGSDQCTLIGCPPHFLRWEVGGQTVTTGQQVTIPVSQNMTIVALYEPSGEPPPPFTVTLTVKSVNISASGASISTSVPIRVTTPSETTDKATQFSVTVNQGSSVTLLILQSNTGQVCAQNTAGTFYWKFDRWTGAVTSTNTQVNLSLSANTTITAEYRCKP